MIRCKMTGCLDMAGVLAKYEHIVFGIMEYDLCESCAEYLGNDFSKIIRITPYANKGLKNKN